jgi:hypothetical protein
MISTRICSYCSTQKPWVFSGKKLRDGTKVYTDREHNRWAGRRCPDCEKDRVQASFRMDKFERDLILDELKKEGYQIVSSCHPFVVEKNGKQFKAGIRHGTIQKDQLILEPGKDSIDLHILVFSSVRLCLSEKMVTIDQQTN